MRFGVLLAAVAALWAGPAMAGPALMLPPYPQGLIYSDQGSGDFIAYRTPNLILPSGRYSLTAEMDVPGVINIEIFETKHYHRPNGNMNETQGSQWASTLDGHTGPFTFNFTIAPSIYNGVFFEEWTAAPKVEFVTAQEPQAFNFTWSLSAIPEPTTWALMVLGVGFAGAAMRRRHALAPAFSS